jgi:arsenical pump membrane protein
MMVLAELARREGLFDWLALYAVRHAGGSGRRLFDLVFLVGTLVTVFLSNDATAVVLTPAVYAACKAAAPTPALPVRLRLHRQCGQLRAAHFQPGQPGGVRPAHAALLQWLAQFALPSLARSVPPICAALGASARDRAAAGGGAGASPADRGRPAERWACCSPAPCCW